MLPMTTVTKMMRVMFYSYSIENYIFDVCEREREKENRIKLYFSSLCYDITMTSWLPLGEAIDLDIVGDYNEGGLLMEEEK